MAGPAFVLAFVVLSAFRDVFFAGALRSAPFFAFALIAFATCTLAFLVVALLERERTLRVVFADMRALLLTNLFTAVSWLAYFQSLRFLEPAIANVLFAGVGPLTVIAMASDRLADRRRGGDDAVRNGLSGRDGILPCRDGGRGARRPLGGRGRHAGADRVRVRGRCRGDDHHRAALRQAPARSGRERGAVVATRFLGVLAAAAVALSFAPDARAAAVSPPTWLAHAPVAFVLMAVPIYLGQIGVKRASPLTVRVLLALGPVFVIGLQSAVGGMTLSGYSLAGVAAYSAIAIVAALARAFSARAATAPAPASAPWR